MPRYGAGFPFPLLDHEAATARVKAAVAAREPFSMIRIGDGEAVTLSVDDSVWLQDLEYLSTHWGAERVTLGAVRQVKEDLQAALRSADLIGLRGDVVNEEAPPDLLEWTSAETAAYIRSEFPLRDNERQILSKIAGRRLAMVNKRMQQQDWSPKQQFCSAWIHWELLATGALDEILEGVAEVALVTSKPELEHVVSRRFGARVTVVPVPEKHVEAPVAASHVPDRYRVIRDELDFPPGSLVLVGAGIPGKAYCHWLKEAGCVALDIGSVADAWIGKPSRPLVLASRFGVPGGTRVPDALRLTGDASQAGRRLTSRWKPERARP